MEEPFHEKKNCYFQKIKINLLKKNKFTEKVKLKLFFKKKCVLYVGIDLATEKDSIYCKLRTIRTLCVSLRLHKQTVFILDVVLKSFCK